MKALKITPKKVGGCVVIPPSKSVSHRMVMSAALAQGTSVIGNILLSQDILATCEAMKALGAEITMAPEGNERYTLTITGSTKLNAQGKTFDCNESGSTLRFLIPLLAMDAKETRVIGRGRLAKRPMKPYFDLFTEQGMDYQCEEEGSYLPLKLNGRIKAGTFTLPGDVSSQFITGLLFVLPLLPGDSTIHITTSLESKPYVDITLEVLSRFGITIETQGDRCFKVAGNQHYTPQSLRVEGDYSQAAFWLVAGLLGEGVDCLDLDEKSCQGDRAIVEIIKKMGGTLTPIDKGYATQKSHTHGTTIDVAQCPDLVPVLAVLAALSSGETRIVGGERLRYKESDRINAMATVLTTLGAQVKETEDGLIFTGVEAFHGGRVDSFNDHRIAMAVAVASVACTGEIILTQAQAVAKSYPEFWEVFNEKGGCAHGIDLGE